MKVSNGKNAIIALLFIICACGIGATAQTLRVMTYNIRNGIGMDEKADIMRTAEVIRRHGADIVAMQEVDSCTNRSDCTDIAKQLAEATGMHATFVPAIDYDGGRYGVALLSRTQPVSIRRIPLPGREERRTAVIAEFPEYAVCCTHLSLTPDDQIASVGIDRGPAAIVLTVIRSGSPHMACRQSVADARLYFHIRSRFRDRSLSARCPIGSRYFGSPPDIH